MQNKAADEDKYEKDEALLQRKVDELYQKIGFKMEGSLNAQQVRLNVKLLDIFGKDYLTQNLSEVDKEKKIKAYLQQMLVDEHNKGGNKLTTIKQESLDHTKQDTPSQSDTFTYDTKPKAIEDKL